MNKLISNSSYDLEEKSLSKSNVYYDDNDGQDDEEENEQGVTRRCVFSEFVKKSFLNKV